MKSEKLRSKRSSPSIDSATSVKISKIIPRLSPALKLNYDITSISRNVWLRVYCLGGETYKPIIPLFLRSLAENREKKRKETDTRRNGLEGTGKKSVFHDPLSDVAEPHEVSIPLVVATMIGHLGEENIQWSFPEDFLTEEKVGAIWRQEYGEPRYSTKAVGQKVRKKTTELFFHEKLLKWFSVFVCRLPGPPPPSLRDIPRRLNIGNEALEPSVDSSEANLSELTNKDG
ncbi:hypothetical protein ALC62_11634 [Cyphomyrmex costatus]|uniref:Uncharacterized protein n=1 Tax=Cyphomyrmex costatus TaxID=456900 RepID=A0A151ICC2_9HYME|nr:hypothetical protein ALC62_11634 [Cyphomyrmex costatus]